MSYFYLVCILISIGMLCWLRIFDVRSSVAQYLNLVIVTISNVGYFFLAISRTLEEALFAQIIGYAGGVFLPVFFFFLVLEICKIDLSKYIKIILILGQCCIYGAVCTIGRNDLFYKNASMHITNGIAVLDKEYGPLHTLENVFMYLYLILAFIVVISAIIKRKSINRKSAITMLILMSIAVIVYYIEKLLKLEYSIIPISYDILMLGALIPIYDSNIYTVYENKNIIAEQLESVGFLTFNTRNAYKGCDKYMEQIFPELSQYKLEQKIGKCSVELQTIVDMVSMINESNVKEDSDIKPFYLNRCYYTGKIHILKNPFGKVIGYTVELRDCTEHYVVMNLQERYNEELTQEVDEKTKQIKSIQEKIILGMAQMVESRDSSTGGHIKRTSDVVRIFANKLLQSNLHIDSDFLNLVIRSAPMHDLGKIGVDDAVLRKQGKFTDEEYDMMKKHSEIGYHMVSEILSGVEESTFVKVAENVAHYHHEKVNGTGYPHGLKGDEIPLEARIMALADVFDALVSKRCYKDAFSFEKAYDIIKKDSGTHFDSQLAEVFLSCKEELEDYYNSN